MTDRRSAPEDLHFSNSETAATLATAEASAKRLANAVNRLSMNGQYILDALAAKLESMQPTSADRLTERERAYLIESGSFSKQQLSQSESKIDRGSLQLLTIQGWLLNLLDTLSLDEVGEFLNEDDDAIRREVTDGQLYAVEVTDRLRFPRWQFSLGSPDKRLPGLASIIEATATRWDWQSVAGFMSTPQPALTGKGSKTPVEWLRDGGDVSAVSEIVASTDWS